MLVIFNLHDMINMMDVELGSNEVCHLFIYLFSFLTYQTDISDCAPLYLIDLYPST